ncbi:Lrp/AsnC family transcriptional regulator [Leisingera methylohalidivorans]|uniref:AsnC family transcriptional regulator n=1 Tax=Leisingera methylohalidivorans DSM 14336 TaxID=999552 RepID=V9VQZ0_9RHOB|nr:Lrp/AsnC family transcriptional regulator [Leisingera methylohalidivorans]AHD00438.1 AsnC family transcriptional regulator [Leisingera methylohalidivorans DSM 14336]
MQTDDMDQRLVSLLRENARRPVAELARHLGLARTTVQARIERLEATGVITGYTLKSSAASRPPLQATVLMSIEPRSGPEVLARLRSLPGVEVVHTTSGRFDLLAQVVAQSTTELDQTIDHIAEARGVRSSESLIHLATKLDRTGQ